MEKIVRARFHIFFPFKIFEIFRCEIFATMPIKKGFLYTFSYNIYIKIFLNPFFDFFRRLQFFFWPLYITYIF